MSSWLNGDGGTCDMPVDFAVAVDLEGLIEESFIGGLVVVQRVGVLGPGAHLQLYAR
jgi:hypothetical protein